MQKKIGKRQTNHQKRFIQLLFSVAILAACSSLLSNVQLGSQTLFANMAEVQVGSLTLENNSPVAPGADVGVIAPDQIRSDRNPVPLRTNTSLLFMSAHPEWGSSRMRGIQILEEWKRKKNSYNSDGVSICSMELCADICVFIGPCHDDRLPSQSCCKVKILDVIDKLLYPEKKFILRHLHEYDALIVNSRYMKYYVRQNLGYNGRIMVLLHHSDPRWYKTITNTSSTSLQFGYIGTIASIGHGNFVNHRELQKLYPIILVDTSMQKIPAEVTFEMDLSIRQLGDPFANFKTSAKVATAAALGHNIITTWEEATKDILPLDYPFALNDSSIENVTKMFDLALKDYDGDQVLWKKGLQMMKEVNKTLSLPTLALEYETFLDDLLISNRTCPCHSCVC